jgi:hypothetical protein
MHYLTFGRRKAKYQLMNKIIFLALAGLLAFTAHAQDSKVTGFRDLVWGTHVDSVYANGLRLSFTKDNKAAEPNTYYLENDNLTLGAAKLTRISYHFNKDNRFKKVVMYTTGKHEGDLKDIVVFKFGGAKTVKEVAPTLKVYVWQVGDVSINLSSNTKDDVVSLILESNWDITSGLLTNMNVKDIMYDGEKITGFRGIKWLSELESVYQNGELLTFLLDKESNRPNTYFLANEKLTFGSVRLRGVSYMFNDNNQLVTIVLKASMDSYAEMKFILNHKFGGAEGVNVFGDDMSVTEWRKGDVTIKLTESGAGDEYSVVIETTGDKTESYIKNRNVGDF